MNKNIEMVAGDTLKLSLSVKDYLGNLLNLTEGYKMTMTARRYYSSVAALLSVDETDGIELNDDGTAEITVASGLTNVEEAYRDKDCVYDIQLTTPDDEIFTLHRGTIRFLSRVTSLD